MDCYIQKCRLLASIEFRCCNMYNSNKSNMKFENNNNNKYYYYFIYRECTKECWRNHSQCIAHLLSCSLTCFDVWCYIAIKNKEARPFTQNHHVMWIKLFLVSVLYFYLIFYFSVNKNRKKNRNSTLFVPPETKTEAKFHNRTSLIKTTYVWSTGPCWHWVTSRTTYMWSTGLVQRLGE